MMDEDISGVDPQGHDLDVVGEGQGQVAPVVRESGVRRARRHCSDRVVRVELEDRDVKGRMNLAQPAQ